MALVPQIQRTDNGLTPHAWRYGRAAEGAGQQYP